MNSGRRVLVGRVLARGWFAGALSLFLMSEWPGYPAEVPPPYEPASLSICLSSPTGAVLCSTPLRFTGYLLQSSVDLLQWQNTGFGFGPAGNTQAVVVSGGSNFYFRLKADTSMALSCLAADATTIQLMWPPIPTAAEYWVFRDRTCIGKTVGRCGYFLDRGLTPDTSYNYFLIAMDTPPGGRHFSEEKSFSTGSSSRIRTRYTVLALGFYPDGPDAGELAHTKTFFRHKVDFFRLASVNCGILEPYKGDFLCIRAAPPLVSGAPSDVDYAKMVVTPYPELDGWSMVDLVEKGDVDLVWVLAAPDYCGFRENALVGNNDINPTGVGERWSPFPVKCSRSFFVNSASSDARAYDAYAHCIEGVMSSMCDGYASNWPRTYPCQVYSLTRTDFTTTVPRNLHLFERFRLADQWNGTGAYASQGNANCGSSHFPPNARRDISGSYDGNYAYYDLLTWQRYIDCAADGWLAFPNLDVTPRKLNGYDLGAFNNYTEGDPAYGAGFGASPERHTSFRFGTDSFHQWWFFHLPHNPGVANGKLNNWWPYLLDFNRFDGRAITWAVEGFPDIAPTAAPISGEYGTETASGQWWGYWHSCNDFGPFGQVAVVDSTSSPALVREGRYALQATIDQEWFQYDGRSDLFYPISRNARWNLSNLSQVSLAIKPGLHAEQILGANPVVRLCANGGNRLEFVPLRNGRYANLLADPALQDPGGWSVIDIPANGSTNWEANVFGYIDPSLGTEAIALAKQQLKRQILAEVNYVEVSIRSDGSRGYRVSFCLDGLRFRLGP